MHMILMIIMTKNIEMTYTTFLTSYYYEKWRRYASANIFHNSCVLFKCECFRIFG